METNKRIVESLNNLVKINNDRIEGYEKASKEAQDSSLKSLFSDMASKSHMIKSQLNSEILKRAGQPVEETTTSGKVFRAWMDFKAALTGKDKKAILNSCEFGEDATQDAYEEVLKSKEELPPDILSLINNQKSQLLEDHDRIKALRDSDAMA